MDTNETTNKNSNTNSVEVSLEKGKPYSWQITSKNKNTSKTAKSEIWKFYLSGAANTNHAPFPAEIIAPKNDAVVSAGSIELSWKVSDVDVGDTHTFDVLIDESDASTVISQDQVDTKTGILQKRLLLGYYCQDSKQNHSHSGVYKFTVE